VAGLMSAAPIAQASTIKVEIWDVLAGPSTCCATNPSVEVQDAARSGGTDEILENLANPFSASYLPRVNEIIADNPLADAVIHIDSAALASGFAVSGMLGDGSIGDPTLNDFFQTTIAGIGGNPVLGTILRLTGMVNVTNGDGFTVRSDDGYSISIGDGSLIENDGLQGPTTTAHLYDGTSGMQAFEMIWFDNQRTKAALELDDLEFVQPVPLPAGLPLLLAGLGGFGWMARRKRNAG
jgi:hypothetical protein